MLLLNLRVQAQLPPKVSSVLSAFSSQTTDTKLLSLEALYPWFFPAPGDSLANDEFPSLNQTKLQTKQAISWVNTGSLFSLGKKQLISRGV